MRDPRQTPSAVNIITTIVRDYLTFIGSVRGHFYWVLSRGVFRGEIKAMAERRGLWIGFPRIEMLG